MSQPPAGGPRLHLARVLDERHVTLTELALGTGLRLGTVSDYKSHRRLPSLRNLWKILTFLGLRLEDVFEPACLPRRQRTPRRGSAYVCDVCTRGDAP